MRSEASEGANTVIGVVVERLAATAAVDNSWNPRVDRMVEMRAGLNGWEFGWNAAADGEGEEEVLMPLLSVEAAAAEMIRGRRRNRRAIESVECEMRELKKVRVNDRV